MNKTEAENVTRSVLDTSIVVDHFKTPTRRRKIAEALEQYDLVFTTSIGVMEFKKTLLQELLTIHGYLVKYKRFTTVRDALQESMHPQAKLRGHIFNNILGVFPRVAADEFTEADDRLLAEEARLKLEVDIPELLHDVRETLVDAVLEKKVGCDRSREVPEKKPNRKNFEPNLPTCRRGVNKSCRVEDVLRTEVLLLLERLVPAEVKAKLGEPQADSLEPTVPKEHAQFFKALKQAREVASNPTIDLSHSQCRNCGDALIAVEAAGSVTHAVSTNRREWEPLCRELGIEFHLMDYGDEAAG